MKYRYRAISDRKEEKRGILEAENQMQAVAMIRENGDLILELEQVHKWREVLTEDIYVAGMKDRDLALFSSQFAAALKAGISVEKTLSILGGQAEKRRWRKCLIKTAQFVKAGGSLADGFEEADPDGFPAAFLEMVRGGEHSGRLAEVFQSLSVYYERRYKAKQKMETSLIYPCFVLGVAVLVLTFIVGWVVPSIAAVLKEMGIDLPLETKILLSISGFLQEHIVALLSAVILAIGGVVCYWKSERGREQLEMIIKKLPMIGKLWDMSIYAQFCHTVATLLQAGVPLPQVLVVTAGSIDNRRTGKKIRQAAGKLQAGESLGMWMKEDGTFPQILKEVCAIGEESGELASMLASMGEYFDTQEEIAARKLAAGLEPALMVVLAIATGFIVISMYLPLLSMYGQM